MIILSVSVVFLTSCSDVLDVLDKVVNANSITYGGQNYKITKISSNASNPVCSSQPAFVIVAESSTSSDRILVSIFNFPKQATAFNISKHISYPCGNNASIFVSEISPSGSSGRIATSSGGGTCTINFGSRQFEIKGVSLDGAGILSGNGSFN